MFFCSIEQHWFRGVSETLYGKVVFKNDRYKLAKFMGLKGLDSTLSYVNEPYEADVDSYNQVQE
jgi:hypothetical protein